MTDGNRTALWRAVIHQAIIDATQSLQPWATSRVRMHQKQTRDWFIRRNRDFLDVCNLAGLDPSHVRNHALPLIEAAAKLDPPTPEPAPRKPRKRRNPIQERQADRMISP